MLDWNQLAERYYQHLAARHYVAGTVGNHRYNLEHFLAYMGELGVEEVSAVTRDMLRDYQALLMEKVNQKGEPVSVWGQNAAVKVVKAFFRFLVEEDYLVGNPATALVYGKRPKRLPRTILSKGEMRKLLRAPNVNTALGYRDRAILELMYSTGLRRSEVENLKVEDVDYQEGYVRVNCGKGAKDRVVPLGKIACRYLENYLKGVRPAFQPDGANRYLFLSLESKEGKVGNAFIGDMVKRYVRKLGWEKKVTPHTLRHTCATLMLKNKAGLRHIQELLGHASVEATQIYTAVTIADLKAEHNRCHPREKERGIV